MKSLMIVVVALLLTWVCYALFKSISASSPEIVRDCSAPGRFVSRSFVDNSLFRGTDNEIDRSWFIYYYEFECEGKTYYAERTSLYGIRKYKEAIIRWPSGHPEQAIVELEDTGSSGQIWLLLVIAVFAIATFLIDSGLLYKVLRINGN